MESLDCCHRSIAHEMPENREKSPSSIEQLYLEYMALSFDDACSRLDKLEHTLSHIEAWNAEILATFLEGAGRVLGECLSIYSGSALLGQFTPQSVAEITVKREQWDSLMERAQSLIVGFCQSWCQVETGNKRDLLGHARIRPFQVFLSITERDGQALHRAPSPANSKELTASNAIHYSLIREMAISLAGKSLSYSQAASILKDSGSEKSVRELLRLRLSEWLVQNKAALFKVFASRLEAAMVARENYTYSNLAGYSTRLDYYSNGTSHAITEFVAGKNKVFARYYEPACTGPGSIPSVFDLSLRPKGGNAPYPTEQAMTDIAGAVSVLGEEISASARSFLSQDRLLIVSKDRPPVMTFAWKLPNWGPYIVGQFTDIYWDASLLAHEVGHAVQALLTQKKAYLAHPVSPLVDETIALVFQLALMDYVCEREDHTARLRALEPIVFGLHRRAQLSLFEERCARACSRSELTATETDRIWYEVFDETRPQNFQMYPHFRHWWGISGWVMQRPLQQFQYCHSTVLALRIFEQIQNDPDKYQPKLVNIIRAGGEITTSEFFEQLDIDCFGLDEAEKAINFLNDTYFARG